MSKRLLASDAAHRVISWLLGRYVALVFHTTRWTRAPAGELVEEMRAGRRCIVVIWHNRVAIMPFGWQWSEHPLVALISDHRDGRLLPDVLAAAEVGYIRIPANAMGQRGRVAETHAKLGAVREIQAAMRAGKMIGVAGDGPRGPRYEVKPWVLSLARINNAEIIIASCSVRRGIIARSWDRLLIPTPFNRGVLIWGGRFYDPRVRGKAELEALRRQIEADLVALTEQADRMVGRDPIV